MKKIMIALLVVASIFVLASCAPAVVTQTLTLKSVDGQVASGSVSVTKDSNAKAYYIADGGYLAVPASEEGEYGTLTYAKTQLNGSSQDTYAFAYKGKIGENGSEDEAKVYIGVLNSDAKSLKTKYAEVTIKASAEWTGSTPVAVALNTTTTEAKKTFAAAGDKIYVDGKEYSAAVDVKSAADAKIGTLAAELTVEKTGIKFTFTDALAATAESVSGKAIKVEVKNGEAVVATYNVTCSHIGTTPKYVAVDLVAETQAEKEVYLDFDLATDESTLYVWRKNSKGEFVKTGYYVSTDTEYDDELVEYIENEDIVDNWSVGEMTISALGKTGKALTGVRFTLDTTYHSGNIASGGNGLVGGGTEEYEYVLKDKNGTEVEYYKVTATVTPKDKGINSILKVAGLSDIAVVGGIDENITNIYCYDAAKAVWEDAAIGVSENGAYPLFDNESSAYVGKIWYNSGEKKINFSTASYVNEKGKTVEATYGKGIVLIGLNKAVNKDLFGGVLYLTYENIEVSETASTVIKVTDAKGSKGSFTIDAEKTDSLYFRYIDSYSKGYVWSTDWYDYFGAAPNEVSDYNQLKYYSKNVANYLNYAGTFTAKTFSAGGFNCRFTANVDDPKTYGQTGYYELAVVDENGNVTATYWLEGTNGYEEEE